MLPTYASNDAASQPVLDSAALDDLRTLDHSPDNSVLAKVVQLYLGDTPHLLRQLHVGLDKADPALIQHAAHTLKSNSAYVGAITIRHLSEQLERMGRSGDISDAGELITQLEEDFLWTAIALDEALRVAR